MKKRERLWNMYGTKARVWLCDFDEELVYDTVADMDPDLLKSAISQANWWLYGKASVKWEYGWTKPEEKMLRRDYTDKFNQRRTAFVRHVLCTIASKHPDIVDNLVEDQCGDS